MHGLIMNNILEDLCAYECLHLTLEKNVNLSYRYAWSLCYYNGTILHIGDFNLNFPPPN